MNGDTNTNGGHPERPFKPTAPRLRRRMRRVWESTLGYTEPQHRAWLKEHEAKGPHAHAMEYQLTFLPNRNAYVTSIGFFHLWRFHDGTKAVTFTQNLDNCDMVPLPGTLGYLREAHGFMLVKAWEPSVHVGFHDIEGAINGYTRLYEKAVVEKGVLYGTSAAGNLFRHAGIAFLHYAPPGDKPRSVYGFLNEIGSENLANPYGDKWWERPVRAFDPGIDMREASHLHNGRHDKKLRAIDASPPMIENFVFALFKRGFRPFLLGKNPVREKDQKLHPIYHRAAKTYWFVRNFFSKGIMRVTEPVEVVSMGKQLADSGLGFVKNLAAGLLSPMIFVELGLNLFDAGKFMAEKFFKRKAPSKLESRLIIKSPKYVAPFDKLLRPIDPDVFAQAEMLKTPVFDAVVPPTLNKAWCEDEERRAMILGPDSNPTLGSLAACHFSDAEPCKAPHEKVHIRRIRRPDGLSLIHLTAENRTFMLYQPQRREGRRQSVMFAFSEELRSYFRGGAAVEVTFDQRYNTKIVRGVTKEEVAREVGKYGVDINEWAAAPNGVVAPTVEKPPVTERRIMQCKWELEEGRLVAHWHFGAVPNILPNAQPFRPRDPSVSGTRPAAVAAAG